MQNKAPLTWAIGDFHIIGARQTIVGEYLCDDVALTAGKKVLDVACGSGNTALAAAARGAHVRGVDVVEPLLERARRRAEATGFSIDFALGDAEKLPFDDGEFDIVLSTFGVMFASDQRRAAAELLRVCKPGGTIGLANWTPESIAAAIFRVTAAHVPPPSHGNKPATAAWGTVAGLQELFGAQARLRLMDRSFVHRFASPDDWVDTFKTYFGPVRYAFEALEEDARRVYEAQLREAVQNYNRATDGTLATAMTYVNVIIER